MSSNLCRWAVAAGLTLSLCACGGGGGTAVSYIPTPTPTPMPTPTPTPTPATYQAFDQTTVLSTFADGLSGDLSIAKGADGNYVITKFDYRSFEVGPGTNSYAFTQPSPGVFAMDIYGFGGSTFHPVDGGPLFTQQGTTDEILQVSKQGVGIDLTYTRFGNYTWLSGSSGYISFLALGVPTVVSDLPTSGTATYNGFVDGLWSDGTTTRRLYGSTATLSADFATGKVQTTLNLTGRDDPFGDFLNSATVALGTFSGTGTLASGTYYFSGPLSGSGGWTGAFNGGFNGPRASEYGYTFDLHNGSGAAAAGVAIGKHN